MSKTETTLKATDPLTVEEITAASELFFPLFNEIDTRMPDSASVEDTLKVMEAVAKLAHKKRAIKKEEKIKEKFGFNKITEDNND